MSRSGKIDTLKGLAILAVVFYHLGLMEFGYLGVDVFLVISGYLTAKSIGKQVEAENFTYWGFLLRRLMRVMPMVLLATAVVLALGLPVMLPDDLENLSQTVVATNVFANNVLQCITTRNYWDVVNEYKPLMHTWYLGVLFQFYAIIPFFFLAARFFERQSRKKATIGLLALGAGASLVLALGQVGEMRFRFYYLPWRFYEFAIGALLALMATRMTPSRWVNVCFGWMSVVGLFALVFDVITLDPAVRLAAVVVCTAVLLQAGVEDFGLGRIAFNNRALTLLGKASLSIYLWHQIVLAFMRYCWTSEVSSGSFACFAFCVGGLSWLTYRFVENGKSIVLTSIPKCVGLCALGFVLINGVALWVYGRAGVLYDIPELESRVGNLRRGMHSAYNHRNYDLNRAFSDSSKRKVLVVGDSYARDWINVLRESSVSNLIEISYAEYCNLPADLDDRFQKADYAFFVTMGGSKGNLPGCFSEGVNRHFAKRGNDWARRHAFLIGTKYFGESNGRFFFRRLGPNGHSQSIRLPTSFEERNKAERESTQYGFVDLISAIRNDDGTIPIFSDTGLFISQDCRHLTHGGAVFLAKKLDGRIREIFQ